MALDKLYRAAAAVPVEYWTAGLCASFFLYVFIRILHNLSPFHPLAHLPGPAIGRITSLYLVWHSYIGDEAQYVRRLHQRYGPCVRIAPDSADFTEVAALEGIYLKKGGFLKPRYYNNFDVDGHASIFSNTNLEKRAARAKTVLPLFSINSVRAGSKPFKDSINRFIDRLKAGKAHGRVNVLDLARGMSIDAVTEYLFGIRYGALADDVDIKHDPASYKMSASAVVDSFVLSSRFWYLSTTAYGWADWIDSIIYPNPAIKQSRDVLNEYADRVIAQAVRDAARQPASKSEFVNYPVRLLRAGFSPSEVRAQCKDVIYAATDTIGMNLTTICFLLSKYPKIYSKLHDEVMAANITCEQDIQNIPYVNWVVKEATRLSMTNPCRFPREIPKGGWTYKDHYYPPGLIVSCSAFEMHHNPEVFPEPFEFKPERWQNATDDMNKSMMPFGLGARGCVAKGLSLLELHQITYDLCQVDVLRGSVPTRDRIEIVEAFTAKITDGHVDLVWQ